MLGHMVEYHTTRGQRVRGYALNVFAKVVSKPYNMIFNDFWSNFGDFWPILGDIGPFLRPNIGGKLGDGYQLQIYINQGFLEPLGTFRAGL
jgi:hypothetical protein